MRVAAIDVGSNTVRLLVATLEDGSVEPVQEERTAVGLARDIERTGRIPDEKIDRAAEVARRYARDAAKLGAARIEVLVTAPARQSRNGSDLVEAITVCDPAARSAAERRRGGAARVRRRGLDVPGASGEHRRRRCRRRLDAARLRYRRRARLVPNARHRLARLAQRHLAHDPPRKDELEELRSSIERAFEGHASPLPRCAVATGGTARALRRVVGRTLGAKQLAKAEAVLSSAPAEELAERFGFPLWRGQTLLAGALVLSEAQRRLGVPLVVARAGLREGAVLESLAEEKAA